MKDETIIKYVQMYKKVQYYNQKSKESENYLKISISDLYRKVASDFFCGSDATVRNAVNVVNKKLKNHDAYVELLLSEE
jgi:hypothetical protein